MRLFQAWKRKRLTSAFIILEWMDLSALWAAKVLKFEYIENSLLNIICETCESPLLVEAMAFIDINSNIRIHMTSLSFISSNWFFTVLFQEDMQNYRGKAFGSLPPHVFALAESAYSSLQVCFNIKICLCSWTYACRGSNSRPRQRYFRSINWTVSVNMIPIYTF